jgi:hypothetical protein
MSSLNLYRYDSVNGTNKTAKVTPKSFKVFHDWDTEEYRLYKNSPAYTLFKPDGIYNRPINITFPSGKVRQVVLVSGGKGIQTSEEIVGQSVLAHQDQERDKYSRYVPSLKIAGQPIGTRYTGSLYYIQHKDDKVYEVFRWVILRKGDPNRAQGQSVIYDLTTYYAETDKVYRIREQWIRWGDKDICCDTGLKRDIAYFYDSPYDVVRPKWSRQMTDFSSKNVSEFPTNPFAEGELAAPRYRHPSPQGGWLYVKEKVAADVAVKSFLWKREIAEAVFKPERVGRMIDRYGMEWIDEIA